MLLRKLFVFGFAASSLFLTACSRYEESRELVAVSRNPLTRTTTIQGSEIETEVAREVPAEPSFLILQKSYQSYKDLICNSPSADGFSMEGPQQLKIWSKNQMIASVQLRNCDIDLVYELKNWRETSQEVLADRKLLRVESRGCSFPSQNLDVSTQKLTIQKKSGFIAVSLNEQRCEAYR